MYYNFFSAERIELQREVLRHPELLMKLDALPLESDFVDKLVQICTYCNVAVDGDYTQADLDYLCDVCTMRLRQKKTSIILPMG
jgi:hypothetical protein